MDDPILPDPEAIPSTPVVEEANRLDRLEQGFLRMNEAMAELSSTVKEAARMVSAPAIQAPQPMGNEQFLNEFASNPQGLIAREAGAAARQIIQENMTPALLQMLESTSTQLVSERAQQVDADLGAGTFDEHFRPQLEKDLAQLRAANPRGLADKQVIGALVDRLYGGDNFPVLMEKRRNYEQLARQKGLSHLVPSGGIPRLRGLNPEAELHPEAELFLREVDRATGEATDRKEFAKSMNTGRESGPGRHRTTLADYLKKENATPEQRKMYGVDKQMGG